jgi:hypothetical protein
MFLPTLGKNFQWLTVGSSLTESPEGGQEKRKVVVDGEFHLLAVVSHCCEFNQGKRNKFLVARLQSPRGNLSAEEKGGLEKSNDVEARVAEGGDVAGVDSFLLDPLPGQFDDQRLVSFTTTTPMPMGMSDDFLKAKVAELDQANRELFRKKLAWFVGRYAEDIPDDQKSLPPVQDGNG